MSKPNTMDDLEKQLNKLLAKIKRGHDTKNEKLVQGGRIQLISLLKEVDRAARLEENELLNIDELPMAVGNKVLERRVKLKASLKGGDV